MTPSFCLLRGLKNLNLSATLGRVRPSFGQAAARQYSSENEDENLSTIARVAKEYTEVYGSKLRVDEAPTRDPKDRSVQIPVDVSIRYLKSEAYKTTYGKDPVWVPYRRNFKGQIPPTLTRSSCIKDNRLATNNPCPICRDEYLVLHYKNVELLKQFVSPGHGGVLPVVKTNICQMQHDNLLTAIMESKELGLFTHDVPFRVYNYDYYKPKKAAQSS